MVVRKVLPEILAIYEAKSIATDFEYFCRKSIWHYDNYLQYDTCLQYWGNINKVGIGTGVTIYYQQCFQHHSQGVKNRPLDRFQMSCRGQPLAKASDPALYQTQTWSKPTTLSPESSPAVSKFSFTTLALFYTFPSTFNHVLFFTDQVLEYIHEHLWHYIQYLSLPQNRLQ